MPKTMFKSDVSDSIGTDTPMLNGSVGRCPTLNYAALTERRERHGGLKAQQSLAWGNALRNKRLRNKPAMTVLIILALSVGSATASFAQKTKIVTKVCLDSIVCGDTRSSYLYNDLGYNTKSTYHRGEFSYRYDYTYNDKGLLVECYNGLLLKIRYNDKGQMIERFTYTNGIINQKTEYTYNAEGYLIEESKYVAVCTGPTCTLNPHLRYTYTYDNKENITETIVYGWGSSGWSLFKKWEHTYDTKENMIEEIRYGRSANGSVEWGYDEKYIYTYDSMGNITEMSIYTWSSSQTEWKYNSITKYEYTYLSYSETDRILPNEPDYYQYIYLNDNQFVRERSNFKFKGIVSEVTTKGVTTTYYWSAREMEVEDNEGDVNIAETPLMASVRVYPNPAGNQLIVEIAGQARNDVQSVEIFDVVGRVVLSGETLRLLGTLKSVETDEITIDVSALASGMYFLKIDNKVVKFVKE